jgi:acetaldehyde dehydrogenase
MSEKTKVAIVGSGNIATDLMFKIMRLSKTLEVTAMAGADAGSDGLARAARLGLATTAGGLADLRSQSFWRDIAIVFDATSASAHAHHDALCRADGKRLVDLTPAAIGPFVVPVVNGEANFDVPNVNLVTCGGQATIPIVAAVASVGRVRYAEIVASIASKSAGPGTRANIDEFTRTTARALETVGGAARGKAIIILNPAEPPMIMRDTVYTLSEATDQAAIETAVEAMVKRVAAYVPGYRLKQRVKFERIGHNAPISIPGVGRFTGLKTSVFLEVEGAAHYLPAYSGNLDIMTSAALQVGEGIAQRSLERRAG